MTIVQLRDRVIDEGIASVLATETGAQQYGALLGFQRCRDLYTPEQFQKAMAEIHDEERIVRHLHQEGLATIDDYWCKVYEGLQVKMVYDTLCVGWGNTDRLYASAVERYARIVGIKYDGEE